MSGPDEDVSDGEKRRVLAVINAGRALRGAEPLGRLPSFREPLSDADKKWVDESEL